MSASVTYQRKRALIIGINKYPRDPLQYCINDATDLKEALQRINFDVTGGVNINLNEFYQIVDTFTDTIQRDDLVLFYFAGHGKQMEDQNYLLPSDYNYDHRGHERDYIADHAINVQYITQKIDDKKCRITIYIFDCCRNLIKTRGTNTTQGLLPMNAPSQTLIIFACAPGKVVQDETRNNRNGSFIENLLKYITISDKDVEEMMRKVAGDVNLQTGGFQLPYRTSSLTEKVCLVANSDQERHSTAWLETIMSQPTHSGASSTDINILLLGQTGIGKKTFINAFANYLTHDTLDTALQGDMQVLIPFAFSFTDPTTYEPFKIMAGTPSENEWCHDPTGTCTQVCQSYNFTIGNRLLRLIDTPSIDDDRGALQDNKNMQHIFTYISQYKHLNSVCILQKPNETICRFLYYIKEILSHLHINVTKNILWVFTHSATHYYIPGSTLPLLRRLFNDISRNDYKFTRDNIVLLENESFRLLALNKDHSEFMHSHLPDYRTSWDKSTVAFRDLVSCTLSWKPHVICETFFLNIAQQFTCKLVRLINDKSSPRLTERNLEKVCIRHVCVQLSQFIKINSILPFNDHISVHREQIFYEELEKQDVGHKYLQCLKEHSITPFTDSIMTFINKIFCEELETLSRATEVSKFLKENSITPFYDYLRHYINNSFKTKLNQQTSDSHFLKYIRESSDFSSNNHQATQDLSSMFYEELIKQTTSAEYLQFLQEKSMVPLNKNTIARICQLIFDEIKWSSDHFNVENIRALINLITDLDSLKELLTTSVDEQTVLFDVSTTDQVSQMKNILKLLNELCALPINGVHIRQYMKELEKAQTDLVGQRENVVKLPASAQSSDLMQKLCAVIEQN